MKNNNKAKAESKLYENILQPSGVFIIIYKNHSQSTKKIKNIRYNDICLVHQRIQSLKKVPSTDKKLKFKS